MRKRTLQLRFVKDTPSTVSDNLITNETSIDYAQLVQESVRVIVVGIVVVSTVTTVLNTISEITVSKFA